MDPGSARLQGFEGIVHGGQQLVLHADQVEGALGGRRVHGGDRGHLVPDAADYPVLERDVVVAVPERSLGDVAGVDHRIDARDGFRRGGVDAQDPGMGIRAALDSPGQQPAQLEIVGVGGAPGDLVGGVELRDPLAHDCVVGPH